MLLGALAMIVDRFVITGGSPAPAAAMAVVAQMPVTPAPAELAIPELPFPKGVKPMSPDADIRDLFAPPTRPPAGDGGRADGSKGANALPKPPTDLDVDRFAAKHHLDALLTDERLRIAVVDDYWLQIGQSLDGCKLIEVMGTRATFACYNGTVALTLSGLELAPRDLK